MKALIVDDKNNSYNVLPDIDVGNFGNAGVATSLTMAIFNNYPIIYLAKSGNVAEHDNK